MAQALSEEEFNRMQAQLLELRTHNYQLSDDLRKNTADLNCICQKNITLERDLIKVQKALSKSKKAQEVEALLNENEMLQGKLHSQEDDFRLQNSTLMQELSKLCSQIEQLEKENQEMREGHRVSATSLSLVEGESPHLQAENSTLQKKTVIQPCCDKVDRQSERGQQTNETDCTAMDGSLLSDSKVLGLGQTKGTTESLEQIQTLKTKELYLKDQNLSMGSELEQRQTDHERLLDQRDDLTSQLQELSFTKSKLMEQLAEEGQKGDKLLHELNEAKKLGEKRKSMLDELAIQMNRQTSDHKEALSDMRLQYEKEVLGVRARYEKELRGLHEDKHRSEEELRTQLQDEKTRTKDLEGLQQIIEKLTAQVQSMERAKEWFEKRLKETEENLEKSTLENQEEIKRLHQEHSLQLAGKVSDIKEVQQKLVEMKKQNEELNKTIGMLKQDISDTLDGQRILEKKGGAVLKDLKRQLQQERKRADKLQERIQEVLTNSKTRTGLEDLVLSEIGSPSRTQQIGDSSSISSFSYREMLKEPITNKTTTGSPLTQRPADLSDDEVGELFQRLAEVQQEKWMLEEKVKHLEVSCSSMAEDICRKSAIIETYVMESKIGAAAGTYAHHGGTGPTEKGGLGFVLREMVKSGDENLREMNKKLQNMLEEQLTKNMHLQKDLEVLSQEIFRLSRDSGPGGSGLASE